MTEILLQSEPTIRLSIFLGVLAAMAIWEVAAPRRRIEIPRFIRWGNNLGLVVIDTIIVRLFFPIAAVGMAILAAQNDWGLFHILPLPGWVVFVLSMLLLDLAIYGQHVVFHAVPFLWRLHRMHHADQDFDVTTGLRFHPLEILISMAIKLAVVVGLGVPAIAVLVFEVVLNATAMFNHSNIRIPDGIERALRFVVVTPDMHRVHHSIHPKETNSNFGFNVPWWDRLFRTYLAQPKDGHEQMVIGLKQFRALRDLWIDRMLLQPFRNNSGGLGGTKILPRIILVTTVVGGAGWIALNRGTLDFSAVEGAIRSFGGWAPFVHVIGFALAAVLFLPGAVFGLIGGAIFGPVWGTFLNLMGATLGATASFLIARYVAADRVRNVANNRLDKVISGVEAEGWRFVAFTRLVPLFPFNFINYALGLTRISLTPYILATFVCMLPGALAFTWLGHAGREAVAGDAAAIRYAMLALALLAAIAFLPRLVRRLRHPESVDWITVEDLVKLTEAGRDLTIIDVREPDEFNGPLVSIQQSTNIPLGDLSENLSMIKKDYPIILVCLTDKRSARAAALLGDAGYSQVSVLRGGVQQWNNGGSRTDQELINSLD